MSSVDATAPWHALAEALAVPDVPRPPSIPDIDWRRLLANVVSPMAELVRTLGPHVVGIAGPPGSGKTTLARAVAAAIGPRAAQVSMDDFYLSSDERAAMGLRFRGGAGSHDLEALVRVLDDVRAGRAPITVPRYDTHADDRGQPETIPDTPRPLILEGYFLGCRSDGYGAVCDLLDLLVFIDVDIDTSRARRFAREEQLRTDGGGLSERDMQSFWDDVLGPGVETLVPLARAEADLVLAIDAAQRVTSALVREDSTDVIGAIDLTPRP
jgi:uridine kinase